MEASKTITADFIVVGGGMAGVCAAVSAARNGAKTILVQDRPMAGGNASSEIRMWICGARCPEFAEAGLLEEVKLANYYYNPTLKYTLWDHVLRDFLEREPNLQCYFNTSIRDARLQNGRLKEVIGWGLTDYTTYHFQAPLFADCSGDSILALPSGAEFRHGREAKDTFQEPWGLPQADTQTMGSSILLQLRKTGDDRPFHAPSWAYHYTDDTIPRKELAQPGDNFWWLEFGGKLDTIGDSRDINRELTRIALGYWEYIKNHPDGRGKGWSLDWVGSLPGKRESRRYVGDYILTQNDTLAGRHFEDVVAYGAWLVDEHPPKAFYHGGEPNRTQELTPGYHIPYRCLYSRNVENLLFAGRNISASHLALSSVRVMATCATLGQAVGTAAALANRHHCTPREVGQFHRKELQQTLMLQDQFLPGLSRENPLIQAAQYDAPALADGTERPDAQGVTPHSLLLRQGEHTSLHFSRPTTIHGIRLVWDSHFQDPKRMRFDEGEELRGILPDSLGKAFTVEAKVNHHWQPLLQIQDNFQRLILLPLPPLDITELRLTLQEERTPGKPARLFALEAL
ncbi:MAG: FAD-dependent oxidoreductase [Oligosphaeraceae bacterium]